MIGSNGEPHRDRRRSRALRPIGAVPHRSPKSARHATQASGNPSMSSGHEGTVPTVADAGRSGR